jgi:spore germination protein GerM
VAIYLERPSPHVLPPSSDVRGVYIVGATAQSPTVAVVDLNQALADGHRSGVLVEELTVASIVQTLTANLDGIQEVKILVEGKERDTLAGHADLSNMFDAGAVGRMMVEQVSTPDVAALR